MVLQRSVENKRVNIESGWLEGVRRIPSPNVNERPPGSVVDLLVVHNISLPPGEFGSAYVEQLFTNCLDCTLHPWFERLRGLTVSAHLLIDRLGRRTLLYIGSFGYIASLGLVSWAFYTGHFAIVPVCIFAFIAAHAVGQGAVIWVFISEIFPNRHRADGQSLGSFTHWIFAALLTTFFPQMVTAFSPGSVFLFFCGMMELPVQ